MELSVRDRRTLGSVLSHFLVTTDDFLGRTSVLEHTIETIDGAEPFLIRPYLYSPVIEDKLKQEIRRMLQLKMIIEESKSNVASPMVPVTKPDGSVRLCLDSRRLNLITKKDQFPVPNSIIDLSKAFWQIPLSNRRRPGQFATSRELTAFIAPGWDYTSPSHAVRAV